MTSRIRLAPVSWMGRLASLALSLLLACGLLTYGLPASAGQASGEHLEPPADSPRLPSSLQRPAVPSGFNTHDAGAIRFSYPPEVRARVQPLIDSADSVRAELITRLGQPVLRDVAVHIARTPAEMATLAPKGASYPKYADGVAYASIGLVLLTLETDAPNARHDLGEVFRHELAHVALHDAVQGRAVPRWFNEGFAVFASGEASYPRLQTLWSATLAETLIPLKDLESGFPRDASTASVAYAQAADVVRFLVRTQERHRFERLVELMRQERGFYGALQTSYGLDVIDLEREWRRDVARRYTFWPVLFSGAFIWSGALLLFFWGWRRRRKRDRLVLEKWDREEALAIERRAAMERAQAEHAQSAEQRVHVVLARTPRPRMSLPTPKREFDVPKVEHDGRWHTLH